MGMAAPVEQVRTARARQRIETRERLLRAALAELRRHGVDGAQVDRIVAAARVSRGSFYFHFPTREDVLLEWERRREEEIVARLGGEREPHAARLPLRDALLEVVSFLDGLASSTDGRLLLDTLAIHVRRGADPASYPLLAEIERRLAAAQRSRELRSDVDARQAAILFLSNLFGFVVARLTSRPPHPDAALLVDVFLSGVTSRRRTAPRPEARARRRGSA
jgi:AcrR family transcriptional regulator